VVTDWPRVERLDAASLVRALRARSGIRLTVEGVMPGGQVGAAIVRWPDGHRSVLGWRPRTRLNDLRRGPLAVVDALRAVGSGYPAPATELALEVAEAVVVIQELLPGCTAARLDGTMLDRLLTLNRLQRERLAGCAGVPPVSLYLQTDGPGFCLHQPARHFHQRSAALERWVFELGNGYPDELAGQDAVHFDFQPSNVLWHDGAISGVLDWDGAGRGDCRFDLVTLRFGLHAGLPAAGVVERLDALLDAMPEHVLLPAWAHMSLRLVDWAIRHFDDAAVDHWLDLAERRVR
jgi:hypothetical protein